MKKLHNIEFAFCLLLCLLSCKQKPCTQKRGGTPEERAEALIDDVFICIAWVEDDRGKDGVYNCGVRWTAAYGITTDENNKLFTKGQVVSKPRAKALAYKHLRTEVFPYLKFVKRDLTDGEIIGVCMFIYNVGGKQFKKSEFLKAINRGDKPEDVVNYMTGFRMSGKKVAGGLLKRHWVTGAIYFGKISIPEVLSFVPARFYDTTNFGNYYWLDKNRKFVYFKKDYYSLRYDETTLSVFHRMNTAKPQEKTVASII